jgi:exonuclease SbcD
MRILHTSDWHLGRSLHGVDLLDHQAAFLDHLVDVVREARVDALLVAGDVYDRAVPPVPAVELLASSLRRLCEHTRVVLTSGNHDSAIRLGFGAHLFTDRVRVHCEVAGVGRPTELPGPDGRTGALVYPLPYLDPDVARCQLADDRLGTPGRSHEAVMAAAMDRVRTDLGQRRGSLGSPVPGIVMAHAFVVGGLPSESERDIRVGGVDSVPSGVFAGSSPETCVDYVALGHLHGPQRVGPALPVAGPVMRYAGSPLAYSFSEHAHHKSTALVELRAGAAPVVELVPAPVPRPLADVTGTLDELQGRAFDGWADSWVRVTVTDDVRPRDLYAAVVRRFPHALIVQHRPERVGPAAPAPLIEHGTDPLEIAEQFVHEVGGRRATPEEVAVLRAAYEGALSLDRSA